MMTIQAASILPATISPASRDPQISFNPLRQGLDLFFL
jgi:hypothetical protein